MGGTFNPVHLGHLVIAEAARDAFALDRVVWIPAGDPPHKGNEDLAPQEDRYQMAKLAIQSNPRFEVSRWEIEREGPSYTLHTLLHYRDDEGVEADDLFFIGGADTMNDILTWHKHEEVIQNCRFLIASRPGHSLENVDERLPRHYLERMQEVPVPGLNITSTDLRQRVRDGRSVRYLVPDAVEAYIREHRLYTGR